MSTNVYAQLDDHFRGYARVRLDDIEFDSGRDLDSRNVRRLLGVFKRSCERENPGNAISVVVEKQIFADLPQQDLHPEATHFFVPEQLPYLKSKVLCLHGKHRICAARSFLSHSERWWIAKIYDSGKNSNTKVRPTFTHTLHTDLSIPAQEHIRYEHSNALKFPNGDILRYHLSAECRGDQKSAETWFGMLPDDQHRRIRQLKNDAMLMEALVALLPFAGLWSDYHLGPLGRDLAMRCREVGSPRNMISNER